MRQADRIRQFAIDHYVAPKAQGRPEITIRAGDVHREMGLSNALPAVCSAIGGKKFASLACVALRDRSGPENGANVYFCFRLDIGPVPKASRTLPTPRAAAARFNTDLDLGDAIALVSCVKSKLPRRAAARDLYTSAWFTKARGLVEASGARWFVLSSLYGLVKPDSVIAPYDYTLNTIGVTDRRAWAKRVLDKLIPELTNCPRVVMFAGMRYREYLIVPLERQGVRVDIPMAGLRRGEQLAWLSHHE